MSENNGLWCGRFHLWTSLDASIVSDRRGGLEWLWICPDCGDVLRRQEFDWPPDIPGDLIGSDYQRLSERALKRLGGTGVPEKGSTGS